MMVMVFDNSRYEWGYVCRDGELILSSYTVDVIRDVCSFLFSSPLLTLFYFALLYLTPLLIVSLFHQPECTRTNNLLQPIVAPLRQLMEVDFSDVKGQEKLDKMTAYASRHLPYGYLYNPFFLSFPFMSLLFFSFPSLPLLCLSTSLFLTR